MADTERRRLLEAIVSESEPVRERYRDGSLLAFELSTNPATAKG